MRINEYDIWFSDSAGNRIDELLPVYLQTGGEAFYRSGLLNVNKGKMNYYCKSLEILEKERIAVISIQDEAYPELLKEIFDPPFLLYYKGELPACDEITCAVVGSRKSTPYGRKTAFEIGKKLGGAGVTVVSGMAIGADTAAQSGCLAAGGKTVAVLGSALDDEVKIQGRDFMEKILEAGGGIISEFNPGTPGLPHNFPRRNRIISGLSRAVVVTEASKRSGTTITARLALEQGRDVFAVPGNIDSALSIGTNQLIREGACPLVSTDSILEELGLECVTSDTAARRLASLGKEEQQVYNVVKKFGAVSLELLASETGKTQPETGAIVSILEIKGIIKREIGKITIAN